VQRDKLTGSYCAAGDRFGYSVAVSGETAVVGAYGDDGYRGSAYVFEKGSSGWVQKAWLMASDGVAGDYFGHSVAISGDTVVVGADGDDINKGSAYVFVKSAGGWPYYSIETAKLTAGAGGATGDLFGYSVAISGGTVVVGAYGDDDHGSWSGSAYVFHKLASGWAQGYLIVKLTAGDGAAHDYFGTSVAISGDTVGVGADGDDINKGSVYVFEKTSSGWSQVVKLMASDRVAEDDFGTSVAISGDTLVVGAWGDDGYRGSAYVFMKTVGGWAFAYQIAKLRASDGAAGHRFGSSVAISGDRVVVGAYGDDSFKGSAYVFEKPKGGWTDMSETSKLTADDGVADDLFGISVSIDGDTAVVGADGDDGCKGSAYVFKMTGSLAPIYMLLLGDDG